ncbi:MAG TPA: thiamine phosphate synthase [Polyangiaceae bacterium]
MAIRDAPKHDGATMLARGLYAIVDVELTIRAGFDVLSFAEAVLDARPAAIQLRAKELGAREHLQLLKGVVRRAESQHIPVYANDRPDLAILAGCSGVHVGQSDVSVPDVRQLDPHLQVGLSTANQEQLQEALALEPDYVAVGPVFPTNSKADADPAVGMRFLAMASQSAKQASIPLVAIGGIDHFRAASVAALAPLGAAISALIPPVPHLGTVSMLTRALHASLGGT